MELSNLCPLCQRQRTYSNKSNFTRCKDKPCHSCANSLSRGGIGNIQPKDGHKVCAHCKDSKSLAEFNYYKNQYRYHSLCKQCSKVSFRTYQQETGRFAKYNITKEDYQRLYDSQQGCCKICLTHNTKLYIDHDHITLLVRGLLCRNCNSAIGFLQDDINILENAIKYLQRST